MAQRISDIDVNGPNYKDQSQSVVKRMDDGPSEEDPALLHVKAIPVRESFTWNKIYIKYMIMITVTTIVIVVIVVGSTCGATDQCSRVRKSGSWIVTPHIDACGDGIVGSGICSDATLCCSDYGYCGSTKEYCFKGACGNGAIGNGNCTNPDLCCSTSGYCGSTSEYCG